jgi:ribose/xylose/arabinose/galactoside ABC-type transport system permease subunit
MGQVRRPALARVAQRHGALLALAAVFLFAALRYEAFATTENLFNVARQNTMLGLVALGMTFVILSGGIDLSVGALVGIGGVTAAALTAHGSGAALLGGIGIGAALGLCNGAVIAKLGIQPFITTLAMMFGARGLTMALTHETAVPVERAAAAFRWLGRGALGPVPIPVALLVLAYVVGALALRYTRFGRHAQALGDNEEAARLSGLDVDRVKVGVYVLSGALSGLAGAVLTARLGTGQPIAGTGWELDAIAAVVVGGTLLTGGRGGPGSTLAGVLLLGVILNLFNLEGTISSWWQLVLRGGFLLAVILVQRAASFQRPRSSP